MADTLQSLRMRIFRLENDVQVLKECLGMQTEHMTAGVLYDGTLPRNLLAEQVIFQLLLSRQIAEDLQLRYDQHRQVMAGLKDWDM